MTPSDDVWTFPQTHKFDLYSLVETVDGGPINMNGSIIKQGQRSKKNKKGESVFDCNSYLVQGRNNSLFYFLEEDLQQRNIF
jgi:hypothetical protein